MKHSQAPGCTSLGDHSTLLTTEIWEKLINESKLSATSTTKAVCKKFEENIKIHCFCKYQIEITTIYLLEFLNWKHTYTKTYSDLLPLQSVCPAALPAVLTAVYQGLYMEATLEQHLHAKHLANQPVNWHKIVSRVNFSLTKTFS